LRPNRISPVASKNSGSSGGLKKPSRPTRIPRSTHRNVARDMTNHLALIKKRPTSRISPASHRGRKIVARCAGGDPLWPGVAQGRVRYERFWALLATVGGEAVWGSASGVLAITRSPESKMSAALSGGDRSEERNASSRPVPRPRPGLPDRSSLSRLVDQERSCHRIGDRRRRSRGSGFRRG